MALRNTQAIWGWPARALHWTMAVLIIGMLGFGFYLTFGFNPGDPSKLGLVQQHKSFGFVVFVLACLRLVWRAVNPAPALPSEMPGIEKAASHAAHIGLYILMFVMPLTGWLMSSASLFNDPGAYPFQIKNMVFGIFEMPDPIDPGDEALSKFFGTVHFYAGLAMVLLLGAHVAGALKHALIERDGVFRRMLVG